MPPLRTALRPAGTSDPTGAKRIAEIEFLRRRLVRAAGPDGAEPPGEVLGLCVAGAGEGIDALALMDGDLRDDMGGRAEAIEADRLAVAGHAVGAMADETGAEQRRGFGVAVFLRQMEAVAPVGDDVVGIAAVDIAAGEMRRVAEILHARQAVVAMAAGPAEPGHADARADGEVADAFAQRLDAADDLVTGHDRIARLRQFAIGDVQVRAAHATGKNTNQDLTGTGLRLWPVGEAQGQAGAVENHRAHGSGFPHSRAVLSSPGKSKAGHPEATGPCVSEAIDQGGEGADRLLRRNARNSFIA